eukprot:6183074-Pleurochrysis_carterae.AAC.2
MSCARRAHTNALVSVTARKPATLAARSQSPCDLHARIGDQQSSACTRPITNGKVKHTTSAAASNEGVRCEQPVSAQAAGRAQGPVFAPHTSRSDSDRKREDT